MRPLLAPIGSPWDGPNDGCSCSGEPCDSCGASCLCCCECEEPAEPVDAADYEQEVA